MTLQKNEINVKSICTVEPYQDICHFIPLIYTRLWRVDLILIAPDPVLLHHTDRVSLGLQAGTDGVQRLDGRPEELEGDRLEHVVHA